MNHNHSNSSSNLNMSVLVICIILETASVLWETQHMLNLFFYVKSINNEFKNASVDKKSARLGFVGLNTTLHLV